MSLISSTSDSPNSRSPLATVVGFLMCSLFSVSGNEQRSIIHGSSFAHTSETVIRSCLNSCYWNTYYLLQRRYIFALAFSKNSSDLKSITRSLPVLVLFIIYISCFCSDITAWNFDLRSLKPSARLTSSYLTSSYSFSDSSCFPPSSHPPFSHFFSLWDSSSVHSFPQALTVSCLWFISPPCPSSSLHIYLSNPPILSLSKFLFSAAHSSVSGWVAFSSAFTCAEILGNKKKKNLVRIYSVYDTFKWMGWKQMSVSPPAHATSNVHLTSSRYR